jgi:hypothetical protein
MKLQENRNEVGIKVLKPYRGSRSEGTNPRKKGTNPRSKGTNKRVHLFLAQILKIVSIKEGRPLTDSEIQQLTNATIEFFVSQYETGDIRD